MFKIIVTTVNIRSKPTKDGRVQKRISKQMKINLKRLRHNLVRAVSLGVVITIIFSITIMPPEQVEAAIAVRGAATTASGSGITSVNINKPTGTLEGDVMVAAISLSGSQSITAPAGWTLVLSGNNGTDVQVDTYYKPAGASEPSSYSFSWTTSTRAAGGILSYDGVDTVNTLDVTGTNATGTGTSVTSTSITTINRGDMLIDVYAINSTLGSSYTPPSGMTERIDLASPAGLFTPVTLGVAEQTFNSPGSTGTRSATSAQSGDWTAYMFALRAAEPTLEQSAYRFSVNADNNNPSFIADNLTAADDRVRGTAFDSINSMFFTVGDNGANWVIQKRRIADGALCTSTNCGVTFGTGGTVTQDIAGSATESAIDVDVDTSTGHIYIVGMDTAIGSGQWHIEKRDMMTGALVTSFDGDGIITYNPSNGLEEATTLQLDTVGGYLYVGGYNATGNDRWSLHKYRMDNGAICTAANCGTAFGTNGIYEYDASNNSDRISAIETDPTNSYLYVSGFMTSNNGRTSWTMQKLRASDAALCTAANCGTLFGVAGTYSSDPTAGDDQILTLQVDSAAGAIYLGGFERSGNNNNASNWRIEKITLDTGVLITGFGGSGCTTNVAGAICQSFTATGLDKLLSMELDGSGGYVYMIGIVDEAGTDSGWRVQKRNRSDGSLVTSWATSGTATVNPSVNKDPPASLVIDIERGLLWGAGGDRTLSTTNMQWYFVQLNLDTGTVWLAAQDTIAGASAKITFRLRILTHVLTETVIPVNLKLQYSPKVNTCDTTFIGESYGDVLTSSGEIQYHDNSTVADATAAITLTGDPVHSGHTTVLETIEESNNVYAINDATTGQDALWDFVLEDSSAFGAYCFRLVNSDGTELDTYTVIPEITFCKDDPKTSAQLRHGTYFCEGQKKSFFWAL